MNLLAGVQVSQSAASGTTSVDMRDEQWVSHFRGTDVVPQICERNVWMTGLRETSEYRIRNCSQSAIDVFDKFLRIKMSSYKSGPSVTIDRRTVDQL